LILTTVRVTVIQRLRLAEALFLYIKNEEMRKNT
jgi:hypothetical protein